MANRYPNGMYKGPSKKQDAISQSLFHSFHVSGTMVTMGTNFEPVSGSCIYDYELDNRTILLVRVSYSGEFIKL